MRYPVRAFIVILVTTAVAGGFALLALVENRALGERLVITKEAELTRMVSLLAQSAERKYGPDVIYNEFRAWGQTVNQLSGYRLSLISHEGAILGDAGLSNDQALHAADNQASRPEVAGALKSGLDSSRRYSAAEGRDYLFVAARITFRRAPDAPPLVLRLGCPMALIREAKNAILKRYAVGALIVTLLAALAAALATRPLDRSIKELTGAARDLADGRLSRRLVRQPRGELALLGLALNHLASRFSRQAARDQATQERLLTILENMAEGVLVTDASGRITHSNPALCRLFQLETAPTGLPGESIRHPEFIEALSRAGRGERIPPLLLTRPGPPEKFIEVRLSPLGDEYQPAGVVAVFHDLTSRQRLYQLRRDIVANVSQELRQPLTALAAAAASLAEKTDHDPELRPIVEVIELHHHRLDELSRDLLELARLESFKTRPIDLPSLKVAELFEEAARMLPSDDASQTDRLKITIEPGAETVPGDRPALLSALRNLIDNALKYSHPGTPVTLAARTSGGGRTMELTVGSQGPVLTPEDLERVFERFYRGEKNRLRHPDGAGLGLAIVKHAAQAHGGTATVTSRPGGETVFTISLPRNPAST